MLVINKAKILEIISNITGSTIENLDENSGMDNIEGWDSFAVINLVVAIEEVTGIDIDPEEVENFTNFKGILSVLDTKGIKVVE